MNVKLADPFSLVQHGPFSNLKQCPSSTSLVLIPSFTINRSITRGQNAKMSASGLLIKDDTYLRCHFLAVSRQEGISRANSWHRIIGLICPRVFLIHLSFFLFYHYLLTFEFQFFSRHAYLRRAQNPRWQVEEGTTGTTHHAQVERRRYDKPTSHLLYFERKITIFPLPST